MRSETFGQFRDDRLRAADLLVSRHVTAARPGRFAANVDDIRALVRHPAAGLAGGRVKLAMPDVPFLCHYRRATELTDRAPYSEITAYLKVHRDRVEQAFQTLAYFDGIHFAPRIAARCLFSAALMDMVCPPSTVFAAYNRVTAPKEIRLYTYNEHEGGGPFQAAEQLRFAAEHL